MGLHGHGLRDRVQNGPAQRGAPPRLQRVRARRYQCQHCYAVVLVVPRGVLPSVRYGAVAIALALSLWSSGEPGWRIREQVSALRSLGEESLHGWRSLRRWARCGAKLWDGVRDGPGAVSTRTAAERVAAQLAAHALVPSGDLATDASEGALRA